MPHVVQSCQCRRASFTMLLCRCSLVNSWPHVSIPEYATLHLSWDLGACRTASRSTVETRPETATHANTRDWVLFLSNRVVASHDNLHKLSFFSSLCEVLFWYDIVEPVLIMIQRCRILLNNEIPALVQIYFNFCCGKAA